MFAETLLQWAASNSTELVSAAIFGGGGAFASALYKGIFVRTRVRRRIAREIIEIQSNLYDRSNPPGGWKGDARREEWMLEPFLNHINLLKRLSEQERLKDTITIALVDYHRKSRAFIEAWARARARHHKSFWDPYDEALQAGTRVLQALGRKRAHRRDIANLEGKKKPEDQDNSSVQLGSPMDELDAVSSGTPAFPGPEGSAAQPSSAGSS
mgnify:CR=1 FL=1